METCSHCGIQINPRYDTPCTVEVDGIQVTVCDSCDNDHRAWGESFGDDTSIYMEAFGGCPHRKWAAEEVAYQQAQAKECAAV